MRTTSQLARPAAAPALIAALGTATGCGKDKEAEQAVKTAGHTFQSVAAGDENSYMSEALSIYKGIDETVAEHAGSETGYAEAAAVTLARRLAEVDGGPLLPPVPVVVDSTGAFPARWLLE